MHRKKIIWAGLACLLLSGLAWPLPAAEDLRKEWAVGQDRISPADLAVTVPSKAPAELTIQDAAAAATRHNVGFRRTVQNLLTAQSALWTTKQRWELDLFGSIARVSDDQTKTESSLGITFSEAALTGADFSVTAELAKLDSADTTASVTLRQPLSRRKGRTSAAYERLRSARNGYRSALLSFFVARQDLIERVISSYFGSIQQQQLVDIQESSVKLAEEAVKDAQLRLEAGLIPEIDLTRAQLRLAREQTSAVLQRQSMRDAMDRLLLLLNFQVGDIPRLITTVSYQPEDVDLQAMVTQASELRPELRLSALAIEDRQAALWISRSEARPSLDAFARWRRTFNGATEPDWGVGLELLLPISSRSLREAVWRAQWGLLMVRQDREALKQQIAAEVRSQVRAAAAARANVEIASQSLEVAKRSLHFAQRMVEEGLRTNRDLLDAQDDLTRSESSLVTSKINYYLATVRLRRAIGMNIAQDLPSERVALTSQSPQETPTK